MAGDSFFSDPSKKRKRSNRTTSMAPRGSNGGSNKQQRNTHGSKSSRARDNEENDNDSSDFDEEEVASDIFDDSDDEKSNKKLQEDEEQEIDSDEEFKSESATDKRRRLAKQYLENLKEEVNTYDFDAADIDKDLIASRLQKDVAETKGYVYKYIADKLLLNESRSVTNRLRSKGITSVAVKYPNVYTTSKDMELAKYDISDPFKKPVKTKYVKGGKKHLEVKKEQMYNGHCDEIYSLAVSPDGKYVVTGGKDNRIVVWSSENIAPIRVLETNNRKGCVYGLIFRRGSDQLYASCGDLKIRTYSINQLAQMETLYGHEDAVVDIASLNQETFVTVGSRDRTALFWKVAEQTNLTFRGGDYVKKSDQKNDKPDNNNNNQDDKKFFEGSIDCVSMIDDSHFVTGSDNGSISLWSLAKKRALFTQRIAHGIQPELSKDRASAETSNEKRTSQIPPAQPYWITSIYAIPYSDVFISGSWNGELKFWKLDKELRSFRPLGVMSNVKGIVTRIDVHEDEKNSNVRVFAALSKEHRLGNWVNAPAGSRNALFSAVIDVQNAGGQM